MEAQINTSFYKQRQYQQQQYSGIPQYPQRNSSNGKNNQRNSSLNKQEMVPFITSNLPKPSNSSTRARLNPQSTNNKINGAVAVMQNYNQSALRHSTSFTDGKHEVTQAAQTTIDSSKTPKSIEKTRATANLNSKSIPPNIRRRNLAPNNNNASKKPSANPTLKADDIAKIFGTQENFMMIKTLLQSQQSFNPTSAKSATIPPLSGARQSAKNLNITPIDIKVEQAMIDLQDMKLKMNEQSSGSVGGKNPNEPKFRLSAYTNLNTTTSDMLPFQLRSGLSSQMPPATVTSSSWFSATKHNNDDNPLDGLNADQLRERLIVAETIMKQQYTRNKELEKLLSVQEVTDEPTSPQSDKIQFIQLQNLIKEMKEREERLENELESKQNEIQKLQQINLSSDKPSTVQFLNLQVQNLQSDLKRNHAKYVDMRQFAFLQIEALVRQLNQNKRNIVQNSNLNVVKQLADKERKHWQEEKSVLESRLADLEAIVSQQSAKLDQQLPQQHPYYI